MPIQIIQANLSNKAHGQAVVSLLDGYACDPMGGNKPLTDFVKQNLVNELTKRTNSVVILAYEDQIPVGLIIAFEGFSTFACKPLLNIHDAMVHLDHRGKGIGKALFDFADKCARDLGCCKMTLEVLSNNKIAQSLYRKCGFEGYELDPQTGHALFWQKNLD